MNDLSKIVRNRLLGYDSLRQAGRSLGICHVYLHRLASGKKTNPSDEVLRKLGIEKVVRITYKKTTKEPTP